MEKEKKYPIKNIVIILSIAAMTLLVAANLLKVGPYDQPISNFIEYDDYDRSYLVDPDYNQMREVYNTLSFEAEDQVEIEQFIDEGHGL